MKKDISQILRAFAASAVSPLLLTCVILSCETGEKSSTVRGTILDKSTLAPIESAWVNTIDTTDGAHYSDVEGAFSLTTFGRIQKFYAGKIGYGTRLIEVPEGEIARQVIVVELERTQ